MEENKYSIVAKNVSKGYKMYSSPKQKLMDLILPKGAGKTFYALKDISFKVEKGEVVGLLGLNGSGKSTLSNILGGVSMPTGGEIEINGESALIAIGLGMNNFLTGIENIELKALMMGYKKNEIEEIKQEIIDFADIGEFINQPLRTYSSGMRSRLGFAISIYTNPDILVIDEALSVGDPTFTQKCLDKMNEFKESGKTIFFVSHSLPQIKQFCNKVMWLEYGVLREYGSIEEVLPKYQRYINEINKMTDKERLEHKKKVLKNQDHSLLKEFKLVDNNLKKFVPNGKFIKNVTLINDNNKIKETFFNIDVSTFAFGFIPSIFRKRYETAIFILISQILNFFIVRFPISIFTNFIVTGIASIFTAKGYLNYLVEYKKFIPYTIWKKVNLEDEDIERKITINKRKNRRIVAISIAFILFTSLTSLGFTYKDVIGSIITSSNSQMKVKNYAIITVNNDKFESILILNSKSNNDLDGIVYPGKIQVKMNNKIDELNKLVNINDVETLKKVIKDNFAIQISDYVLLNKDDIKSSDNIKAVDLYKNIFTGLFELSESDFNNKVKEIQKKYPNIDKSLVKEFYDNFKDSNVNISNLKYEIVLLGDIVDGEILQALNLSNKANYKFLTVDKRILQNNELVKNINKKYNEYLEKGKKDSEEDLEEPIWNEYDELQEENSGGTGEIITPPSNSGGTGGSITPPSNSGGTGGSITPPSNSGGTGESTPPSGNGGTGGSTTPPSDNGGTGESTPPSGNGGSGESTPPPSGNGGSGESTTPPSGNGGTGGSTTPPSDNGGTGGSTTPPADNGGAGESTPPPSDNGGAGGSTTPPADNGGTEESTATPAN
ncbi:teichoic acids export ABC transporter ATP-binding subunit TagH [Clostridium sp.]|uniref:teichoic acids export ABC transporter ATP-binding subunit TagH n=1 Tax=Clostridium sp. TaxID=1506 RepID=UPI00290E4888|nr:teichoic acids export ABC transporter ATP-binding subunit TagH [Clostridium sp.]MDU3408969.1 teichoic acids export ABC transporter ATP-binding subunit TagH [Clostridium sp.]